MLCPLSGHKTYMESEIINRLDEYPMQVYEPCLEEECAWWHTYLDKYAMYQSACVLIHIADKLEVNK